MSDTYPADDIAISVRNVSKMYSLYGDPRDRLKQSLWYALPQFLRGKPREFYREFWALRDISFEVKKGEALGIIGKNGSGKSTILQIIAGTLAPTSGEVHVTGRIAALLELGSGFNPEFTGRENVYLNGAILGFGREEMDERFDDIAAFADIGQFIDQPVKLYSSGMSVRLAFAVQACVEPDVLIVDEALSVGDIFFQQKCHARMEDLMARHTAIILVTHDMGYIEKYSTQAILLDQGHTIFSGQPEEAVYRYYHISQGQDRPSKSKTTPAQPIDTSQPKTERVPYGSNTIPDWPAQDAFLDISQTVVVGDEDVARCTSIALCNRQGEPCTIFQIGEVAHFYYEFDLLQDIEVPLAGVAFINSMNITVHAKSSLHYLLEAPTFIRKGTRIRFRQTVEMALKLGEYTFTVGFSTMCAEDYAHVTEMSSGQVSQKHKAILRVTQAGQFLIREKDQGIAVPFYGYADLKGDSIMTVIPVEHRA